MNTILVPDSSVNEAGVKTGISLPNVTAHVPPTGIIRNGKTLLAVMEHIQLCCRKTSVFCKGTVYLSKKVKIRGKCVSESTIERCISRLREIGAIRVILYPGLLREIQPLMTLIECRELIETLSFPAEIRERMVVREYTTSRTDGFIYLLKSGNIYKIGMTKKFSQRLSAIQSGNPDEIEYVASYRTADMAHSEDHWHTRFASQQVRGEWFRLTDEQVEEFVQHCAKKESE